MGSTKSTEGGVYAPLPTTNPTGYFSRGGRLDTGPSAAAGGENPGRGTKQRPELQCACAEVRSSSAPLKRKYYLFSFLVVYDLIYF